MTGVFKKLPLMSKAGYEKVTAAGYKEDNKQFRSETGAKVPLIGNLKQTEDTYVNSYLDWKKRKAASSSTDVSSTTRSSLGG